MCKNFRETGACKYGDRCLFAHGDHELINRGATATASAPPASSSTEKKEEDKKESSDIAVATSEEEKSKVVQDETTNDSTKVLAEADQAQDDSSTTTKKDQKLSVKEQCSENASVVNNRSPNLTDNSCESDVINVPEEEIQDHGENSTTLSSIDNVQHRAQSEADRGEGADNLLSQTQDAVAEASSNKSSCQFQKNFDCEDEIKELLENLDIQNIQIKAGVSSSATETGGSKGVMKQKK